MCQSRRLAWATLAVGLVWAGPLHAEPPQVRPEAWRQTFADHPELFEQGVHTADKPEQAFVCTGKVSLDGLDLKNARDRDTASQRAELAAERELLQYVYKRDRDQLKLPPHLEKFADEALRYDAHRRTLVVEGMITAAVWVDKGQMWCTLIVAQGNVRRAREFADMFRAAAVSRFLDGYNRQKAPADLYRAFEVDPEGKGVRDALSRYFLERGHRLAAYVVLRANAPLPKPDDPLAKFLAGLKDPAWDEAVGRFEAEKPDLDKALEGFLRALDTRYAEADAFNYGGACYREQGWPRLASVFFEQALAQSDRQLHRYALTNLGLCLADLDQPEAAARYLQKAVEAFPDEPWTAQARKALEKLDARKKP